MFGVKNFCKTAVIIGISASIATLLISIISAVLCFGQLNKPILNDDKVIFNVHNKSKIKDIRCIVGMMVAPCNKIPVCDSLFLVPPTTNLSNASVSAHCMWARTNGNFGRHLWEFFPGYSTGEVDISIVVGACYEREKVPSGAEILFSDEKFKFYESCLHGKIIERKIYIFTKKADDNYLMPMADQTAVYQLTKKDQSKSDILFIQHNRLLRYDIRAFYNNIDSSDDIDYDLYSPLP